ncbi:MAG: hypothetical protein NC905_06810 [Candidatus Omnitrophica bacterium]|nr:hypothetical protein [Candidatus Omnitrophota bacterium]
MIKKSLIFLSLINIVFFPGCNRKTAEIPLPLSETEIQEAIEYGIKNAELSTTEFVSDWSVDLGYGEGKGKATLITPFLKVAFLAKQAQIQGQKVKRDIIEKVLKEDSDCLVFDILLFGGYPQFGRTVEFSLKYDGKEIQPVYKFIPPYAEISRDYTQSVKGNVKFKKTDIPKNCIVVLKAQFNMSEEPEVKEKYTCEFEFALNKYR